MLPSNNRTSYVGILFRTTLVALCFWASAVSANDEGSPAATPLETIVVTAKKLPDTVPDTIVKKQVETALHDDRYFYDGHVTVTVKNGIVHLEGIVFDIGDIQNARRIIRREVSGVKRVVNELEICSCDGGGGG